MSVSLGMVEIAQLSVKEAWGGPRLKGVLGHLSNFTSQLLKSSAASFIEVFDLIKPLLKASDKVLLHRRLESLTHILIIHEGIHSGKEIVLTHDIEGKVNEHFRQGLAETKDLHACGVDPIGGKKKGTHLGFISVPIHLRQNGSFGKIFTLDEPIPEQGWVDIALTKCRRAVGQTPGSKIRQLVVFKERRGHFGDLEAGIGGMQVGTGTDQILDLAKDELVELGAPRHLVGEQLEEKCEEGGREGRWSRGLGASAVQG
ncbi:hypothetical protein BDN71DRAFT_1428565 [Pleurotus eryngii]|uniref:Uncharacterized protein n=1 Tax=Pleurotus eryngii TaxID=5323 RepID=A0A9P6A7I6_PLEER|nr:hypothetical protein BDN71DRAFT_1428565 [Pleurotus eryngii]